MKTILVALVVLGFVREAGAISYDRRYAHDYTITIGQHQFGFQDNIQYDNYGPIGYFGYVQLGPLGVRPVSFSATQGLIGFCIILAMLITLPVVLTVRVKKKRVTP